MIVIILKGGLGNQMFQYACGRALAIKNETKLILDTTFLNDKFFKIFFSSRSYKLNIFNIEAHFSFFSRMSKLVPIPIFWTCLNYVSYYIKSIFKYGEYISEKEENFLKKDLTLKKNIYLNGYWQNEEYFKNYTNFIQREFSFKRELFGLGRVILNRICSCESVCVHVRRGDYITNKKALETHGFVGIKYYKDAIEIIKQKVKNPHFFIFSDDIEWCKNNIKTKEQKTYVSCGDNDLQLMTFCKHFVIANSSFSWWGAWLSKNTEKVVIVPKQWYVNSDLNNRHVVPKKWIEI